MSLTAFVTLVSQSYKVELPCNIQTRNYLSYIIHACTSSGFAHRGEGLLFMLPQTYAQIESSGAQCLCCTLHGPLQRHSQPQLIESKHRLPTALMQTCLPPDTRRLQAAKDEFKRSYVYRLSWSMFFSLLANDAVKPLRRCFSRSCFPSHQYACFGVTVMCSLHIYK